MMEAELRRLFVEWLLAELRALEAADPPAVETTVDAVDATGQVSRTADGREVRTNRQSNLLARPGQGLTTVPHAGLNRALGDGMRQPPPLLPRRSAAVPQRGVYPDTPPWALRIPDAEGGLYDNTGSGFAGQLVAAFAYRPEAADLMPPVPGPAGRRLLGHRPEWGDWLWLDDVVPDTGFYAAGMQNGEPFVRGYRLPRWEAISSGSPELLYLPVDEGTTPPTLYSWPPRRSVADPTTAVQRGDPPTDGAGLIYHPELDTQVTLRLLPDWLCVYPAGDHATRYVEYAWNVPTDYTPLGDEAATADGGLDVTLFDGPLSTWITVTEDPVPVVRATDTGVAEEGDTMLADTYRFEPPGAMAESPNKVWTFERTWTFGHQYTVQPDDWIVAPNGAFLDDTLGALIGTYGTGTTTITVSGLLYVKAYAAGDENDTTPTTPPWLVQPDPGDSGTWYWVDCDIHVGDYIWLLPPTEEAGPSWVANEINADGVGQQALVIDVQPDDPNNPDLDVWHLTLRSPISGADPTYDLLVSKFRMPPLYFGDAGAARTFDVGDTVTIRARPTTLLRPSTIAYDVAPYNVETNWIDHTYPGGDPAPRQGLLWLLHTVGWEVEFERTQTLQVDGGPVAQESKVYTSLFNLAEDAAATSQQVHMISPGHNALRTMAGLARWQPRIPEWNSLTALLNQGYSEGAVQFRRAPLPDDDPNDPHVLYWDCPAPPAVPTLDVANDWPLTEYRITDHGYWNPCLHPDVHDGSAALGDAPQMADHIFRRDHYRRFDGAVIARLIHPPNTNVRQHQPGVENVYTRAFHGAMNPTLYEGTYGTLYNPVGLAPGESGGTWAGITIPTRWYDADVFIAGGVTYGVVLAWHEDRAGEVDEFEVLVSRGGALAASHPLPHYFPDGADGQPATTFHDVYSGGSWPNPSALIRLSPSYTFLHPDWPFEVGQVGVFTARPYRRSAVRLGFQTSSAFVGTPVVLLGFL